MQNSNDKAINRFVDSAIFLLFVWAYFLGTGKIIAEIFAVSPITYRGMMYGVGQIVACVFTFGVLRDIARDISSGREDNTSE